MLRQSISLPIIIKTVNILNVIFYLKPKDQPLCKLTSIQLQNIPFTKSNYYIELIFDPTFVMFAKLSIEMFS